MSEKFPGFKQREDMIQFAADIRAETMKILHEERDKDRALLERMVNHLTVPPRSTWRVVQLAGDDTPHDVGIEFPAQVVYVDNGSTANVQVRAPGDIAQSPPIAASGQGAWLIPGATQLTVTGTGIGQVRLRFLNEAAARLLYTGGPGGSTASPVYAELTGSLAPKPNLGTGYAVPGLQNQTIAASASLLVQGITETSGYDQMGAVVSTLATTNYSVTLGNSVLGGLGLGAQGSAAAGNQVFVGPVSVLSSESFIYIVNNSSTTSMTTATPTGVGAQ